MDAPSKRAALSFFAIAIALAIAIAASLPSLRFEAGIPLPEADAARSILVLPYGQAGIALPIGRFIITVLAVVIAAIVLVAAIRATVLNRKAVLLFIGKSLVVVVGSALLLLIIFSLFPHASLYQPATVAKHPPPAVSLYEGEAPKPLPKILVWIVGTSAAVFVAVLCLRFLTGRDHARRGLDTVALEARAARLALLGGRDFRDVILDCYRRMRVALEQESGIERELSMTAREFEALLEKKGVPQESVHRLTLLFESVRYGGRSPSPDEEGEAIGCLESIERYVKTGKTA